MNYDDWKATDPRDSAPDQDPRDDPRHDEPSEDPCESCTSHACSEWTSEDDPPPPCGLGRPETQDDCAFCPGPDARIPIDGPISAGSVVEIRAGRARQWQPNESFGDAFRRMSRTMLETERDRSARAALWHMAQMMECIASLDSKGAVEHAQEAAAYTADSVRFCGVLAKLELNKKV